MGKPFVLSLNPGIGSHLSAYSEQGFDVRLALEPRTLGRQSIDKNLKVRTHEDDPRKFYNRKQKGVDDLLQLLGLTDVGSLDVLDVTTNLQTYDDQRRPQNLFDVFGIARRLEPKIVIAFAPQEVAENKNRQRFNSFLDYLRYDHLRDPELRKYFVTFATLDAADFGSAVRKRVTLVIGVRSDVAAASDLYTDQGILSLLPKSKPCSTLGDVAPNTDANDDDFWFLQTAKEVALKKAIQLLPKEPSRAEILSLTPRQKKECGYKKSHAVKIARASFNDAIPDPIKYHVIHPKQSRLLTNSELQNAYGFPRNWKHAGNEVQVRSLIEHAIPTPFVNCLLSQTVLPLLNGTAKVGHRSDNRLEKIRLADTLRQPDTMRRTYQVPIDVGFDASCERIAELPSGDDYDFLFDANEINQDFVVYGPYDPEIGRRPIVGAIQRKVFQDKDRLNLMKAVDKVKETTGARINCASVPITPERLAKYDREGRTYEVAEDGRSFRLRVEQKGSTEAHWDRWRTEEMPSAMYGWHRDKNTRLPTMSKTMAMNAKVRQGWQDFNATVEQSYRKLALEDFKKQAKFLRSWVPEKCRLGGSIFTTMSIQKYGPNFPSMAFHIDAGDDCSPSAPMAQI
jgi:site-specific DNA-cytosine methylase